jgi:hypothetical protein
LSEEEDTMKNAVLVAKMVCNARSESPVYPMEPGKVGAEKVDLTPVYAQDGPNLKWSKATPSGRLELQINNPDAMGAVKLGQHYLVYLVPCGQDE